MEEDKITYARQFLLDLLEKRRLRSWCQESGALHISMFKIARGVMNPTYAVMCHLLPYIPPGALGLLYRRGNPLRSANSSRMETGRCFRFCPMPQTRLEGDWAKIRNFGEPCEQYIREPPCASYGFPYTERKEKYYTDMGVLN